MPLVLDELKNKLANDPAAKGFYTALMEARVADGEVHSAPDCISGGNVTKITLGEVLELDYSHECMEEAYFKFAEYSGGSANTIFYLLSSLKNIPHHDEFVNTEPDSVTLNLFLQMFCLHYYTNFYDEIFSIPASLKWLNIAKGYPADAKEIMDIFLKQLSKSPTFDFSQKKLETATSPMFLVSLPADFSLYSLLIVGSLSAAAIHLKLKEFQAPGSNLFVLPPHLFELFNQVDESSRDAKLEITSKPPLEKLLTVNMLYSNGMTLKEAWSSASKL